MGKQYTIEESVEIGKKIGVDFSQTSPIQFKMGMNVELEHGTKAGKYNLTNDDPEATGKIAMAHIMEIPDYYTRLAEMESAAKK